MAVADKDARNPTPDSSAPPTVIVDDVHVTYRVVRLPPVRNE